MAMLSLMKTAEADHVRLGTMGGISGHIRDTGAMTIFDSASARDKAFAHEAENARLIGCNVEKLTAEEARRRVPALQGAFAGAIFSDGYKTFDYPLTFLRRLQAVLRERATLLDATVSSVARAENGVLVRTEGGREFTFDRLAITAGVWSRRFVADLGLTVLLETERGYNTTFMNPSTTLEMPVFFSEHGFRRHPLRKRAAHRRRGGARLAGSPRQLQACRRHAQKKCAATCRIFRKRAARNGWAVVPRRRTRCPSSACIPATRASPLPSVTAISA
jgi:D-amino-acid dehydrogenase